MSDNWEMRRVSTSEEVFEVITKRLPQPVGIVLFGADCDSKDEAYMECVERIPNLATGYGSEGNISLHTAKQPLSDGRSVLTVMSGSSSGMHEERRNVIRTLRELGAKSVVGIYAEAEADPNLYRSVAEFQALCAQLRWISGCPPTAEGLDLFLIR